MNDPFPAYAPSEEHELLRETVRALAEDKIAPHAADGRREGAASRRRPATRWSPPTCTPCTSRRRTAVRAPTRWRRSS